jgi:hypothetical protein
MVTEDYAGISYKASSHASSAKLNQGDQVHSRYLFQTHRRASIPDLLVMLFDQRVSRDDPPDLRFHRILAVSDETFDVQMSTWGYFLFSLDLRRYK